MFSPFVSTWNPFWHTLPKICLLIYKLDHFFPFTRFPLNCFPLFSEISHPPFLTRYYLTVTYVRGRQSKGDRYHNYKLQWTLTACLEVSRDGGLWKYRALWRKVTGFLGEDSILSWLSLEVTRLISGSLWLARHALFL